MLEYTQEHAARLQDSLSALRKAAGWSAEDLAKELGVTRQTIVNLEKKQTRITKIQYWALIKVFEEQAGKSELLARLISILVTSDDLDAAERDSLKKAIDTAANRVGRRSGAAAVGENVKKLLQDSRFLIAFGLTASILGLGKAGLDIAHGKEK